MEHVCCVFAVYIVAKHLFLFESRSAFFSHYSHWQRVVWYVRKLRKKLADMRMFDQKLNHLERGNVETSGFR
jgi:hypothetical protein